MSGFSYPFSLHNLALLSDWLNENGELYVDVYWAKSGHSGTAFFIHSLQDLKSLVASSQTMTGHWITIYFTVLRQLQFPLRGIANEELLERALKQIPDNQPFEIVYLRYFPEMRNHGDGGKNHSDLRREFTEVSGELICIGQEPDVESENLGSKVNEIFTVSFKQDSASSMSKNQDFYEPYAKHPEHYQWIEELWRV
ncbi:MAG: hypothetical protein H0X30_35020 [Anaerolineae bacterium]|nr:hypothetical protein [Anaerolineae bacterium]